MTPRQLRLLALGLVASLVVYLSYYSLIYGAVDVTRMPQPYTSRFTNTNTTQNATIKTKEDDLDLLLQFHLDRANQSQSKDSLETVQTIQTPVRTEPAISPVLPKITPKIVKPQPIVVKPVPKIVQPQPKIEPKIVTNTTKKPVAMADILASGIPTRQVYVSGHSQPHPELCPYLGNDLKLLIFIMSAPNHAEARQAIRQTWGHYRIRVDVEIAFLLGSTNNTDLNKKIAEEDSIYGDVVSGNFLDTYNNLTLKTVSMLEWIDNYCPHVKYILKTDDDMFINVDNLLKLIKLKINDKRTIFGRLAKNWKPIRNKKSKYYVSPQQYLPKVFPHFTTGPAYLMTRDCVRDLYEGALDQKYLKLEDVFTTGIVADKLKIKRVNVDSFLNRRVALHPCNVQKGVSIHMVRFSEQFDLWKKMLDGKTKCK